MENFVKKNILMKFFFKCHISSTQQAGIDPGRGPADAALELERQRRHAPLGALQQTIGKGDASA